MSASDNSVASERASEPRDRSEPSKPASEGACRGSPRGEAPRARLEAPVRALNLPIVSRYDARKPNVAGSSRISGFPRGCEAVPGLLCREVIPMSPARSPAPESRVASYPTR